MKPVFRFALLSTLACFALAILGTDIGQAAKPTKKDAQHKQSKLLKQTELPDRGIAWLIPTKGSDVRGVVRLTETPKGLQLRGQVMGLEPGSHGFHIHEFGDLSNPQGKAAGGHFNPGGHKHGAPNDEEHHAGDLGNIEANQDGVAKVNIMAPWLELHVVLGRSIVVHAGSDDLESQPSGDAGPRAAVGVIGISGPEQEK